MQHNTTYNKTHYSSIHHLYIQIKASIEKRDSPAALACAGTGETGVENPRGLQAVDCLLLGARSIHK